MPNLQQGAGPAGLETGGIGQASAPKDAEEPAASEMQTRRDQIEPRISRERMAAEARERKDPEAEKLRNAHGA